jgi:hypothetical protein
MNKKLRQLFAVLFNVFLFFERTLFPFFYFFKVEKHLIR